MFDVEPICSPAGRPPIVDADDPLFVVCKADEGPRYSPYLGTGPGVATVTYAYADDGSLERVVNDCREDGSAVVREAERDDTGRTFRWLGSEYWDGEQLRRRTQEMTYGDDGRLTAVAWTDYSQTGDTYGFRHALGHHNDGRTSSYVTEDYQNEILEGRADWSFGYDDAKQLTAIDATNEAGEPRYTVRIEYDEDRIVTSYAGYPHHDDFIEVSFDWDGDRLRGGETRYMGMVAAERYELDEAGRVIRLERDLDGEPMTTVDFTYDEQGRLVEALYWGHRSFRAD